MEEFETRFEAPVPVSFAQVAGSPRSRLVLFVDEGIEETTGLERCGLDPDVCARAKDPIDELELRREAG